MSSTWHETFNPVVYLAIMFKLVYQEVMADFIECLGEVHNANISLFTVIQISSHVVDFDLYLRRCCIRQAIFMISEFNWFTFSEKLGMHFLFFCSLWSLASGKSVWFRTFMSDSIVQFKIPDISRNLNWKIVLVRERKWFGNFYSRLAINTQFLLALSKINSQMRVF